MASSSSQKIQALLVRLVTENLAFKVLALVFATLLWAWVQADQVVEVRTRATVAYDWPEGLVRARQVPSTLVVTVSGPQGVVRRLKRGTLKLSVDLHDSAAGTVAVDFGQLELAGLPAGVDVVQISPPAVDIDLEKALTKEVEVRPTIIGDPAPGYALDSVRSVPPTVHISGPQSRVQELAQVATDVVNIAGLSGDKEITAALAIPDPVLEPADGAPRHVQVEVRVEPIIAERVFEAVPVRIAEDGFVADPATVKLTVRGPQASLQRVRLDEVEVVVLAVGDADADGKRQRTWQPGGGDGLEVRLGSDADIEVLDVAPRRIALVEQP